MISGEVTESASAAPSAGASSALENGCLMYFIMSARGSRTCGSANTTSVVQCCHLAIKSTEMHDFLHEPLAVDVAQLRERCERIAGRLQGGRQEGEYATRMGTPQIKR